MEEIMAKHFPNLMKIINPEIQGTWQNPNIPSAGNMKKTTQKHIIIRLPKISDKENILTAARGKRHFTKQNTHTKTKKKIKTKVRFLMVNKASEKTLVQIF